MAEFNSNWDALKIKWETLVPSDATSTSGQGDVNSISVSADGTWTAEVQNNGTGQAVWNFDNIGPNADLLTDQIHVFFARFTDISATVASGEQVTVKIISKANGVAFEVGPTNLSGGAWDSEGDLGLSPPSALTSTVSEVSGVMLNSADFGAAIARIVSSGSPTYHDGFNGASGTPGSPKVEVLTDTSANTISFKPQVALIRLSDLF